MSRVLDHTITVIAFGLIVCVTVGAGLFALGAFVADLAEE